MKLYINGSKILAIKLETKFNIKFTNKSNSQPLGSHKNKKTFAI